MGVRFRKSANLGPLRINVSKSGIGASVGTKGYRVTKTASGRTRTTASIPGTGISYVKESNGTANSATNNAVDAAANGTVNGPTNSAINGAASGEKPLIDKIFKPIVIVCLSIVAVAGLILFLLGSQKSNSTPKLPEQEAETQATSGDEVSGLSAEQLQPFLDATAKLGADGQASIATDLNVSAVTIYWWSPTLAEKVESSDTTPPDGWDTLLSDAAAITADMLDEAKSLNFKALYLEVVNGESKENIYATCLNGKVSYSKYQKSQANDNVQKSRTVYVTKTGKRYHYDKNCNGGSYYEIDLDTAANRGLTPCQKCVG